MSKGKYYGIAPKCHFVSVKVLDKRGNGNTANVVEGIHWLVNNQKRYNLKVINISVGMVLSAQSTERVNLLKAVDYAWDSGLVVVAAAGNNGPSKSSVTIPGVSRKVITVGCYDDTREQIVGKGLKPDYSGQGPTESCIVKPEIVTPGTNITSCSTQKNYYAKKSGTSMAAPIVSGCVALLLNKYPMLTPAQVKLRFYDKAVDLGLPVRKQGWGTIDINRLLW